MNENHAKLMPSPEWAAFLTRLQTAGFAAITLHVSYNLVFTARKE